jgi:primosomal protein N' (replication factor Y)
LASAEDSSLPLHIAAVALEQGIDHVLDYSIPPRLVGRVVAGQRVRVPLGRNNRPAHGWVVGLPAKSEYPVIKPIAEIDDPRVLLPPAMMELARWMSRYYITPLGIVLDAMIPSAVKKRIGVGYIHAIRLAKSREDIQALVEKTKAPRRRAILGRLLLLGPEETIELIRLASESGASVPTIRKLARLGLISITAQADLQSWSMAADEAGPADQNPIELNEDQSAVMAKLLPRVLAGGFSVDLLHGVTGSGKTELYLQCIAAVTKTGRQAIVLVPEIALTPQTARRFRQRFKRVAILHSGLGATQRHRFWQQISQGQADVVVGARSAIFAPVPNLGIIVVDEEHEPSYKQDTAPRYHGRDVAIKRAQIENVPIILGSATPSLETYYRVTTRGAGGASGSPLSRSPCTQGEGRGGGSSISMEPREPAPTLTLPLSTRGGDKMEAPSAAPYRLLELPRRVRGLAMPAVELVDMALERRQRKGIHLISGRLHNLLTSTIAAGHQAIILINRRGYANYVYCPSCTSVVQCKYCDSTMTYHRSGDAHVGSGSFEKGLHTGQLHCHYCLAVNPLPSACPECGKKLSLFGLGTQRVEEELAGKFPGLRFARVDSDSMHSAKDYEALLGRFEAGEIQVMLGTQMIAKGLDYPNVTLVGVISGDTALSLPDFRAAERTFQLITQVAGRAGRGDAPGRVVLQTFLPTDPTIQAALRQDYAAFAATELGHRRQVNLPPVSRMVRIILRDQDDIRLHQRAAELAAELGDAIERAGAAAIVLRGPMPCPISRIAGYHRDQIVLTAPTPGPLQKVLAAVRTTSGLTKAHQIAVDVDPVSLL